MPITELPADVYAPPPAPTVIYGDGVLDPGQGVGSAWAAVEHFEGAVGLADVAPVTLAPAVYASPARFDSSPGVSLLAPPAALALSPGRGWLLDSFTLPTWDQLIGSQNSLGSTVLSFVEEENRAALERAKLSGALEIERLRASSYPYRGYSASAPFVWPDFTKKIPGWAIVLAVVLVLVVLLKKLL